MFTWPLFPNLPDVRVPEYRSRLHARLTDLLGEHAKIGRQLQNPPTLRRTKDQAQSIADVFANKVTFATIGWDTHGYWDATNNRYLPLDFSGYYRVSAKVTFAQQTDPVGSRRCAIYRNGTEYASAELPPVSTLKLTVGITDLVYLNGQSDYVEVFVICGEACSIMFEPYRTAFAIEYVGADQLL